MKETKNDKFRRLMQSRLSRVFEDFRLISQLASSNYRNTPEEAEEVVLHLSNGVQAVAKTYDVPFRFWVGGSSSKIPPQMGEINEIDAAKAIAMIQAGSPQDAITLLQAAINKEPR